MGRRAQLLTLARLELSQAVYDEIEIKLLEAGHEHRFWRGPGTAIDMTGIWVEREPSKIPPRDPEADLDAMVVRWNAQWKPGDDGDDQLVMTKYGLITGPAGSRYCFGCDRMVTQPCERVDCMEAAKEAVP
jgi:hypothetical protein